MKDDPSADAEEWRRWQSVRSSYDAIAEEYASRIYAELKDKLFNCDWLDRFADECAHRDLYAIWAVEQVVRFGNPSSITWVNVVLVIMKRKLMP